MGINCLDFVDAHYSRINVGSDSLIDNLPQGADGFTAELWVKIDSWNSWNNNADLITKQQASGGGWAFRAFNLYSYTKLTGFIQDSGGNTWSYVNTVDFNYANHFKLWHHLVMTFDFYGDKKIHIWIDGVEATYHTQITMSGTPNNDENAVMFLGNQYSTARGLNGQMGWARISDVVRYTSSFLPPHRCILPTIDVDTIAQWIGVEGLGSVATVDNQEGTAALDGVATLCNGEDLCEGAIFPGTRLKEVRLG